MFLIQGSSVFCIKNVKSNVFIIYFLNLLKSKIDLALHGSGFKRTFSTTFKFVLVIFNTGFSKLASLKLNLKGFFFILNLLLKSKKFKNSDFLFIFLNKNLFFLKFSAKFILCAKYKDLSLLRGLRIYQKNKNNLNAHLHL